MPLGAFLINDEVMKILYTIQVRDKHNPPEFKEGMGKGSLIEMSAEFKGATEEDLKDPEFVKQILETGQEQLADYIEVIWKIKEDEES